MKRRSIAWILSCAVLASSFPQGTFESSAASVVEVETETQESTVQGSAAPIVIEGSEIANAELDSANIDMSTKQSESITETAEPLMTETIETSAAEIPVPESAPVTENTVPETAPAQIPETNAPEIVITPSTESEVLETSAPVIITETPTVESEGAAAVPETPDAETSAAETESPVVITEYPDPQSTESDSVPAEETTVQEPSGEDGIIVLDGEEVQAEPSVSAFTAEIEQPWIYEKIQYGHLDDMGISLTLAYSDGTMEQWVYEEEETGYSQETNLSFYKAEDPSVLIPEEALTAGEYQMSISFRDQECIVPVQVKSLAEIPDVLSEGETVVSEGYYRFAAGESGAYSFASADGSFLVMSEDGVELMASENGYVLDAGENYYFRLEALEDGDLDVSFEIQRIPGESEDVVVEEAEEVAELLEADAAGEILLGEEKEIASGEYYRFMPEEDGWYVLYSQYFTDEGLSTYFYESTMNIMQGPQTWGNTGSSWEKYAQLNAGEEYFIRYDGQKTNQTVRVEKAVLGGAQEGDNAAVLTENGTRLYTFVPDRDGYFTIRNYSVGYDGFYKGNSWCGMPYQLTEGEMYVFLVTGTGETGEAAFAIEEVPVLKNLELLSDPYVLAGIYNNLSNLQFRLTYEDGRSEEIYPYEYTSSGSYFTSSLYDPETESYVYEPIEGKSYELLCNVDGKQWEFEVTAKKPEEIFNEEIGLSQETEIKEASYYKFIPTEDGYYILQGALSPENDQWINFYDSSLGQINGITMWDSAELYIQLQAENTYFIKYDSNGQEPTRTVRLERAVPVEVREGVNTIEFSENEQKFCEFVPEHDGYFSVFSDSVNVGGFYQGNNFIGYPCHLTAGETYALFLNGWWEGEHSFTIKEVPVLDKMELLSEPVILEGQDFDYSYLTFRLTYEDGSSEEVHPYVTTMSGSSLNPRLYDVETGDYVYTPIEETVYNLVCDLDGKRWEFKVTARKATDVFKEELVLGQEQELNSNHYYQFRPNESGIYYIENVDRLDNADIVFYDDRLNRLSSVSSASYGNGWYISIEAGNVYFLYPQKWSNDGTINDSSIKIRTEKVEMLSPEEEKTLESGQMAFELSDMETGIFQFSFDGSGRFCLSNLVTGEYSWLELEGNVDTENVQLDAGGKYLIEGDIDQSGIFTYRQIPSITNIELAEYTGKTEFLEAYETVQMDGLAIQVSYSNGSSQQVTFYGTAAKDTYGNIFYFRYYPEDTYLKGDYDVWYDSSYDLTAGTYYMALEGYESNAVKIQILSLQEFAEKNFVKLDEPYLFAGGSNYCAFVFDPETSGSYEFTFRPGGIGSLRIYDSEMQSVFEDYSQHKYQVSLNAGERYYGMFMRTNWNAEIQMTVSALSGLREIDVRTEQKEFIAGLEYVTPGAIEVETIYEDGRTGIVNGRNQDFRGNSFDYELEGNEGIQELGSSLSIGTYTITASAKSDAEIQDTTEIRAVALETASLPLVEENQDVAMELTELKFTLARFVPQSNGEYQAVLWEDEDMKRSVEFYRQTSEGLEAVEELTAGDVYIFVVPESRNDSYSSVQFRLVKKTETEEPEEPDTPDIPEGWETSKGGELTLDQPQEVTIVSSQKSTVEYTFTPEESGLYVFESGTIDNSYPWVELYECTDNDPDYWNYLDETYTSDDMQFSLSYRLEKGHTYAYRVISHSNYTRFMVTLSKVPETPLKSVRFVLGQEEYVEFFDFSESDSNNDYFWGNFKLSYENGEIKEKRVDIYGDESVFTDDFGNEIRHSYQFLEETEDTYVYRITVSCGELQSTTDVMVRKLESLDTKQLQLNERYETEFQGETDRFGNEYVTFTPEKTGSYYIIKEELESPGDEFVGTQVVSSSGERIGGGSLFEMTAGETYYIQLSFRNGFRFAVTVSELKVVSGVEILSDNTEISMKDYYLDTAETQIRVNYSDGSYWDREVSIWGWDYDLYENDVQIESYLEGADSVRLTALVYPYAEDGSYYWDSKLFTLQDDISTLNVGETADLTYSGDKDIVRIVPEKTGVYAFTYQGEGYLESYALYNGTHRKVLSYRNSWTLEAGTEYLLQVQVSEGASGDNIRLVSRNSHTMEDTWHTMLAATCTSEGQEYRKCMDEGCNYTETRTVAALGHQFGEELREEATDTETGRVYQVCARCGLEKVLEILPVEIQEVQDVIDQVGALGDDAGTDEIVEAVQNVINISNEELANGGASEAIIALEEKVVQNEIAGTTVTEGSIESKAEGAALSVVAYQDQIAEGKTGAAKVSVEKAANENEYADEEIFENRKLFVMDIQLSIVNAEDSSEVFAADVQPSAPIQMTVSIPEEFQGKEFELYHVTETGIERVHYQSADGKTMTFTVTGLSDYVLKLTDCNGEHQYTEQVVKQPTCVEEGEAKLICSNCGYETTKVILATGVHSWTTKVDQAATCGAEGSQHRECTVCGFKETATTIPATGNHSWTTKVDQAATCGAAGRQHKECTVCGTKEASETIPATGNHSWTTKVDQAATCGAAGSQHKECTVCGTKGATETVPATGNHSWTTKVDQAATCGAAGSQHQECSVCGAKGATETIPATGAHSYKEVISKEATCGEDGRKFEQCSVCGAQKAAQTIPATGKHQYGSYKVTKEATVLAEGTKTRTCSVCKDEDTATVKKLRATIKVNAKSIPLKVKQSTTAVKVTYGKGDKITSWRSSNKKVATVTSKGKITGKKAGKAVITVTLKSGKTAKITVKVQKTAVKTTKLKLNKKSLTLRKGKKYQLTATVTPITSSEKVKYKSSNKKVLTVTSKGKITAKKKGTAYVIVTSGKKTVRCKVKVK